MIFPFLFILNDLDTENKEILKIKNNKYYILAYNLKILLQTLKYNKIIEKELIYNNITEFKNWRNTYDTKRNY